MVANTAAATSHIRVGVKRASKRIMGYRGDPGHTICGAPLTDRDVTLAEARRLRPETVAGVCQMCLAKMPAVR